ncbi:MAG: Gfo/Idh/MocA family oxidoreductase [Magnetococcales bacterium]|nr:Gfo/Idh/MocA family oxidoreductase [Magnetococcales bacterium]MBF0323166.1 Gfo/Idh/MocA family oxidoreductase [Magnetococcales bacterium]
MRGDSHVWTKNHLRAAVIGVGYLGRFHAQKYRQMPGVDLVAVVDRNEDAGRRVAAELQVPLVADFRDILHQVDLISVVVPTPLHFAIAKVCLQAGVHLLIEKPMTTNLAEADELILLAAQNKCLLQVGHLKRFHPAVVALRQSGLLNRCRFIEAHRFAPFKNRALDVDVTLDLMIHDVDLILDFVRSEVTDIVAFGRSIITRHVDVAHARLQFANGCMANISAARVAREAVRSMHILQDDAYISLDFIHKNVHLIRRRSPAEQLDGRGNPSVTPEHLPIQDHDTLEMEIRAFCAAVRDGLASPVPGQDGRRALAVIMDIREAIQTTAGDVA